MNCGGTGGAIRERNLPGDTKQLEGCDQFYLGFEDRVTGLLKEQPWAHAPRA